MAKNGHESNAPKATEMTKAQIKALFATADSAELDVAKAKDALDKAIARRSAAVGVIKEKVGAGPFTYQGRVVTIRSRQETTEDEEGNRVAVEGGRLTHFFVGPRSQNVMAID